MKKKSGHEKEAWTAVQMTVSFMVYIGAVMIVCLIGIPFLISLF